MTWNIDPAHTSISVAARHLMLSTVRASFAGASGEIDLDPARPERASVRLAIPAATVDTGDDKRDAHLRSADFLDAEKYPEITFVSTGVRKTADQRFTVAGDLTIRGTTRPVDVDVELNGIVDAMKGKVAGFTATATIDRTQWGLVWNMPVPGGVLVSEKLRLQADVEAVQADARDAEQVAA